MLKRFWNYITDENQIASGFTVISFIFIACAGLAMVTIF
jgi:hypothetical protein